jgi:hypothetical protein
MAVFISLPSSRFESWSPLSLFHYPPNSASLGCEMHGYLLSLSALYLSHSHVKRKRFRQMTMDLVLGALNADGIHVRKADGELRSGRFVFRNAS